MSYKTGYRSTGEEVKKLLEKIFDQVKLESKELAEDSEFDIVVLTGGEVYEEPTSTPAPTTTSVTQTPAPTANISLTPTVITSPSPTP